MGGGWKRGSKGPPPPQINFSAAFAPPPPPPLSTTPKEVLVFFCAGPQILAPSGNTFRYSSGWWCKISTSSPARFVVASKRRLRDLPAQAKIARLPRFGRKRGPSQKLIQLQSRMGGVADGLSFGWDKPQPKVHNGKANVSVTRWKNGVARMDVPPRLVLRSDMDFVYKLNHSLGNSCMPHVAEIAWERLNAAWR